MSKSKGRRRKVAKPARPSLKARARTAGARRKTGATRAAASNAAPLRLEEARRLAATPKVAAPRADAPRPGAAVAGAAPADVGFARRRLRAGQRDETKERIRSYRETYRLLEERGFALHPRRAGATAPAAAGERPLRILAEGDSWFDYPALVRGGLVSRLESRIGVPILNLAHAGDEVRYMLGVEQRRRLEKVVGDAAPEGAWDAVLFSGGGNDIVDNPMCLWVRDYDAAKTPDWHVEPQRFQASLDIVRAGYEDLIGLRDRLSPNTVLFLHAYDFAIPTGKGVCFFGPWLKPTFQYRKFPADPAYGAAVVRVMLERFEAVLQSLAAAHPKVVVVPTQGVLDAHPNWWHNELHPNSDGFNAFVERFRNALAMSFPGRVR